MLEFLKTINLDYGNLLTFLSAVILIGVTVYYAIETHKQAKASIEQAKASITIVQDAKDRANRELEYYNNVKSNLIFQINAEMVFNSHFYVDTLSYFLPLQQSKKNQAFILLEYADNTFWKLINVEATKYLPQHIMEDIVGYYTTMQIINSQCKNINDKHLDVDIDPFEQTIKCQLSTYIRIREMMEKELGRELKKADIYEVNGQCFKVNKDTGNIELI